MGFEEKPPDLSARSFQVIALELCFAADHPPQGSPRRETDVLEVLRGQRFDDRSGTVIAVALTSREPKAGFPLTLESKAEGLPKRSWVKIGQIRTLAVQRIGARVGRAPEEEVQRVIEGLNEIIG